MHTIRSRISLLLLICSIAAILLISLFVNITINNKFNQYMIDIQNKRYDRIVEYFQEVYKRDGKWTSSSGVEISHEAYMSNYCLTLYDDNKKVVWGMDPNDMNEKYHFSNMLINNKGVYNAKTFEIKSDSNIVGYVEIGQYSSVLLSEEDMNFKSSINKSIIASSAITIFIIIIISLYFSKQFSRPVREVANMSVNLSKGKFDRRSNIKSKISELSDLSSSINILAEKLKHQEMLRRRLVQDISHEIRTPLNILQNNLEAMVDGVFSVTTDRLCDLNEEVKRFGKLLDNLDVLKQFELEDISYNFETIQLNELVNTVYKDFKLIAEEKNIVLECNIKGNLNYITVGDRDKIRQVLINLLSNAIKFTNNNGHIWVTMYESKNKIIIEIKDDGIGINEEDKKFIFERMYRGDKSRHQIKGSGIGLTIVREILLMHSASIEVESQKNTGATFRIYFNKEN